MTFDLAVVGGGMSGVCAAVAAAREGASTVLVQERPVFGGSGSSEIRVPLSGSASSNAWSAETGLIHEIALIDRATNPGGARPTGCHLDLILDDLVRTTANLTVVRNTVVHDVTASDGVIEALAGRQLGSETTFRFEAKQVVDATGDGTIAALAGARTRYGREARQEHGESLAPVVADDSTLGSTIVMQARRTSRPVPYSPPDWAIDYSNTTLTFDRAAPRIEGDLLSGFWWIEVNDPFHQIDDNASIRDQLHRHVLGMWDFLKNHSDRREELACFALEWVGQLPGKRESRRVEGDVLITQEHVQLDPQWPDEVGYGGWWIDLHVKGAVANLDAPAERENVDAYYRGFARVAPFSIPLRACYSRDVGNLWVVGRCLSATHVGLGPIRVQQTLAQLGQSIGIAAAQAIESGAAPRELAHDEQAVGRLQQRLLRRDVRLLHTQNSDPDDLARIADVDAASLPLELGDETARWRPLDIARAQVIPEVGTAGSRRLSFRLRYRGAGVRRVAVCVEELDLIWDREPQPVTMLGHIDVRGGSDGWHGIDWPQPGLGRPVRISLVETGSPDGPHVEWAHADGAPTGALVEHLIDAPGGPEPKNIHVPVFARDEIEIPPYRLWRQVRRETALMRMEPPARPYEAANVTNGRAAPGRGANVWVSPPRLPQTLELRWATPQDICSAELTFDTDLDTATDSRPGLDRAAECIRDLDVEVDVGAGWQRVGVIRDNYRRRCAVTFERLRAHRLRLVVLATNGDPCARLYEVRVYGHSIADA